MNTVESQHDTLDALLEGWRRPHVCTDFTKSLLAMLPEQDHPEVPSRVVAFPSLFGPGSIMGAAAAILLLLVIGLAHTSRTKLANDLVEQDSHSDEAMSELYRLINLEGLAATDEFGMEDADTALLLFATGR